MTETTQRRRAQLADADDDGVQDLDLSASEKQELEAAGAYIDVDVADITVRVKPQGDWRLSDMRQLNVGDLDAWAEGVIHPDDIEEFFEADITVDEFKQFADDASRRTGDGLGKSSPRSRSSRSRRKR